MTTRWTEVLSSRGESGSAKNSLRELCDQYYAPVYAFVFAYTQQDQNARDLTHSFFLKLLESNGLKYVTSDRGRFRTYLLGAVKHFIADEHAKQRAEKRGGKVAHISMEDNCVETAGQAFPPDAYFDRQWALTVLQQALSVLESEVVGSARSDIVQARSLWDALKPWLSGDLMEQTQTQIAKQFELTQEQVKTTLHRWRKRFREIVKSLIADTVDVKEGIGAELDYLIQALSFKT